MIVGNKLTDNIIRELVSAIEDEKEIEIPLLDEDEEFNCQTADYLR